VALVTGGSRGIGREIALALSAEGTKVAVGYNMTSDGGIFKPASMAAGA
jgi:NAD(P)-dependent dehydrogenase (short-subunit alcohol dehydrogenase family)